MEPSRRGGGGGGEWGYCGVGNFQMLLSGDSKQKRTKTLKQQTKRKETKNRTVQVSDKYLCLRAPSLLSRSLTKQEESVISALTGLYQLTECPLHRNTKTYTQPENDQFKIVDLATEKS